MYPLVGKIINTIVDEILNNDLNLNDIEDIKNRIIQLKGEYI